MSNISWLRKFWKIKHPAASSEELNPEEIKEQQIIINEIHIPISISIGIALKKVSMKSEDH